MTRGYPMADLKPHESGDHVHHRSLWFSYEGVGGINNWGEPEPGNKLDGNLGETVHREFIRVEDGESSAVIVTRNDLLDAKGNRVCDDLRTLEFGATGDIRWIDFQIVLRACEGELHIGDSKEGAFSVRVAETMKVDAGLGGRFVNSRGQVNGDAWGMPAEWVDYHGPVDNELVGIAIFSHPSSFRPAPGGMFASTGFSALIHSVKPRSHRLRDTSRALLRSPPATSSHSATVSYSTVAMKSKPRSPISLPRMQAGTERSVLYAGVTRLLYLPKCMQSAQTF
jgi:hypothetical protein